MFERVFSWLESRTDTFPPVKPTKPGNTLWGFVWHYTKPFWPMILVCSALASAVALIEVWLFSFMGNLVDWLEHRRSRHLLAGSQNQTHYHGGAGSGRPAGPQILVRGRLPSGPPRQFRHAHPLAGASLCAAPEHRVLSERFRRPHRHQGDADRDGHARHGDEDDRNPPLFRRLFHRRRGHVRGRATCACAIPLVLWFFGYLLAMRLLRAAARPRCRRRRPTPARWSPAASSTAIPTSQTVKLFAHADREDFYAREGMGHMLGTVHRSHAHHDAHDSRAQRPECLAAVLDRRPLDLAVVDRMRSPPAPSPSLSALSCASRAWRTGSCGRSPGLFENIGIVQDGIETIARDRTISSMRPMPSRSSSTRAKSASMASLSTMAKTG